MTYDWVFAGSGFWVEKESGRRHYHAEGGELICVSNFSTATLDVPVRSPQDNADLLFVAFEERIPPLGTPVHLKLKPRAQPRTGSEQPGTGSEQPGTGSEQPGTGSEQPGKGHPDNVPTEEQHSTSSGTP